MGPVPAVLWRMGSQQDGHCEALTESQLSAASGAVSELELPSSPHVPMPGAVPLAPPVWELWVFSQLGFDTNVAPLSVQGMQQGW